MHATGPWLFVLWEMYQVPAAGIWFLSYISCTCCKCSSNRDVNMIKSNLTMNMSYSYKTLNFKLYLSCLFYNNNTWLQIGHKVILLGGELIRNIFGQGKPLSFLPWIKKPILLVAVVGFKPTTSTSRIGFFIQGRKTLTYSCRLWDSNPRPPSHSVVVLTPRLA